MDHSFSRESLVEWLEEIGAMRMPFGKFGPRDYPPDGLPIYDLPLEYLQWFQVKGFPRGKLGRLMEMVYRTKLDGADEVFDILRARTGGRRSLRVKRKREFDLGESDRE